MYDDDVTRIPADEHEMWEVLWEQFEHARYVLWELPVETKEDALSNTYHREYDGKARRGGMHVVRYRNESGELGQRDYFLTMGRELLPYVHQTCPWHDAPFGKLMATPTDGRPVTQWPDRDQAFLEVANAIKDAAKRIKPATAPTGVRTASPNIPSVAIATGPRSSNLRLAKEFSDRDRDRFKQEVFDFMAKFFENSLVELEARNSWIETSFRRIDANRFIAAIYKNGKATAQCTVFMGAGHLGGGISYVATETTESNTYNENLSVEADDQTLYLRSMGMAQLGSAHDVKLSAEGAAEFYWSLLIRYLQ